jgi:hypothetical protein
MVTPNCAYVSRTHWTTWFHFASPALNAETVDGWFGIPEVLVSELLLPGLIWQPPAQRLR